VRERPVVLVADDDRDILELVSVALEREGYELLLASNGEEALEVARMRLPDLAVLDVMMPRLDGCEVTRRLRSHEATGEMRVILLSAFAEETQAARGLAAGADLYVKKPFSPRDLAAQVARLLAEPRDAAASAS
jgi:DNA-binding response OmpR family regulator